MAMKQEKCRFCGEVLSQSFCDLGTSPLSNAYLNLEQLHYLRNDQLHEMEPFYPLHPKVCSRCFLVQLPEFQSPKKIFSDYAYFSSYSDSWLKHCEEYTNYMINRFHFGPKSLVVEVASNDGYLLKYFQAKGVPVLGIEPAKNVAEKALQEGIPTVIEFFGTDLATRLAAEGKKADLLLGNNVLAHVPDLNGFVRGMKILLAPGGIITMEFPHLLRLMEENQFDTIYHEHFSYFSLLTVEKVFAAQGLTLIDVQEIPTHGGSLRIFARHMEDADKKVLSSVAELRKKEIDAGLMKMETYAAFMARVIAVKHDLLDFLIKAKRSGMKVAGYGAPAKGNTLLNYCGIKADLLEYTVDRSPHKQGRFLPGVHIPVFHPDKILETKPDYLLILPWNIKSEIIEQMSAIRRWGGKFVVPIPKIEVIP